MRFVYQNGIIFLLKINYFLLKHHLIKLTDTKNVN